MDLHALFKGTLRSDRFMLHAESEEQGIPVERCRVWNREIDLNRYLGVGVLGKLVAEKMLGAWSYAIMQSFGCRRLIPFAREPPISPKPINPKVLIIYTKPQFKNDLNWNTNTESEKTVVEVFLSIKIFLDYCNAKKKFCQRFIALNCEWRVLPCFYKKKNLIKNSFVSKFSMDTWENNKKGRENRKRDEFIKSLWKNIC